MKRPSLLLAALLSTSSLPAQFVDKTPGLKPLPDVADGFEVTLFAQDPLVRNPCSLAFDARGRMFVGMGPQYRNPTPETPPDSIVMLADTNGDGVADKAHPFATGFNCIQGLAWHGKDLWVANAPDLTVVRDVDGDDTADEYVRIFTDLGNIEHGIHGLNWAPDGRLYMSKGNSKGVVIKDWKKDEPWRIAPKPFRELWGVPGPADAPDFPPPATFTRETYQRAWQDPRDDWGRMGGVLRCDDMGANLEIVARGFRNPFDVTFDDGFDWLGTDQDQNEGDRIIMPFFGAEFGWSHAWSPHWTGKDHLPTAPVSGPVFTGSGTGIVWADSPAWPDKYRKVWIINDWLLKSTHVYRPTWEGALMQPQGGKWEGFIEGREALFRPVNMKFGADGALYILGWGRGYGVERDAGNNMTNEGRIFRIMPRGAPSLPPPGIINPADMSLGQLISELDHVLPVRQTSAQDELVRRGAAVHADLFAILASGKLTKAQETWTIWALARSGATVVPLIKMATEGPLNLRLQAIRILGYLKSPMLGSVVDAALEDGEPRVRFAAVQAVHQGNLASFSNKLISHAGREKDRIAYYATWRALRDLLASWQLRPLLQHPKAGVRCAALLALIDTQSIPPEQLEAMVHDPDPSVQTVAMLGLGKKSPAPATPELLTPAFPPVSNLRAESKRPYVTGTLALGQPSYTDRPYAFTQVPDLVKGASIIRTANGDDDSRGNQFLTFDLKLAASVIVAHDTRLKERPQWLQSFSDTDLIVSTDDTTFRLWTREFPAGPVTLGGNISQPALGKANYFVIVQPKPLPPPATPTLQDASMAALTHADPRRGEALFFLTAGCAACHRTGDRGINFGPDLTNAGDRLEAKFLVQSMLEPSAVITEGFSAHAVEAGGKNYFGMLLSTGKIIKLGLPGGVAVELPADTITKHETLPVSPMPPQGAVLGPQEVADIAAWLLSQKSATPGPVAADASPAATPGKAPAVPAKGLPAGEGIQFELRDDRIVMAWSSKPLTDFVFSDPMILRPYFANVHTLDAILVTRNHPPIAGQDAMDHADMHPGIWLAFGDISGHDFWRNKGRIAHDKFSSPPTLKDGQLTFSQEARLLSAADAPLGTLLNQCKLKPTRDGLLLTWAAVFVAGNGGITFGDQEEMGFGARMATVLTEKKGGLITSSGGLQTAARTWGQPADWCDYAGDINGRRCGITLMASPQNFRRPWWHNRDYGVFVANPFGRSAMKQGEKSAVTVKAGESLRLQFSALIHSGQNYDPAAVFLTNYP